MIYCITALCLWHILESLNIYPHYLSYFNQLAGGPDGGYRRLSYANIDYGQDLPALHDYLKREGIEEVVLAYCGTADISAYGINYRMFRDEEREEPGEAVYAVSVSNLNGVKWAEGSTPTAKAGYSIFIYDKRKSRMRND